VVFLAFYGSAITATRAQERRLLSKTVSAGELLAGGEVRVGLDGARISDSDLTGLVVTLEAVPSGQPLDYTGIRLRLDDSQPGQLMIRIDRFSAPPLFDNRIKVSVLLPNAEASQDKEKEEREAAKVAALRELHNRFLDSIESTAKARIAYAKTSRERNLYISGGFRGGEMAANHVFSTGNVWRMRNLVSQIDVGLSLDKGSGSTSDPDFLNMGVNFRKIFPLHRRSIANEISPLLDAARHSSNALDAARGENTGEFNQFADALMSGTGMVTDEIDRRGPAFFRAIVVTPLAPRLETSLRGHHEGFLINFINSSDVQVRTGAVPVFGKENLTWEMKLTPLALEAGTVLRNPDDRARKGSPLVRLNAGASGKLTYKFNCGADLFLNRIELEIRGTNRHLFNDESAFDRITGKADALVRGNKYAAQADFRFIFGLRIPLKYFSRHPAVTVTYKNGFFPPLYAYNNSVSVHFTLETDDDSSFNDMSLRVGEAEKMRKALGH
jgi:hypothetical protein